MLERSWWTTHRCALDKSPTHFTSICVTSTVSSSFPAPAQSFRLFTIYSIFFSSFSCSGFSANNQSCHPLIIGDIPGLRTFIVAMSKDGEILNRARMPFCSVSENTFFLTVKKPLGSPYKVKKKIVYTKTIMHHAMCMSSDWFLCYLGNT